ncbi:tyrosine-protein phosphatase [Aquitalea sp. LB_tupeE]|uniref:tyrosine-protein phosphatase n=1 Tax=Aquitalea sp. LB_tupeE TaxID=2748078 RepID=UPI0015BA382C|nr:tyrosine-protein phosphatase [Aquitalea sp. LB_tupeE]NWK77107.1 tyrosine-protein phosphatase [Aquitalea sp. LB_tupeE]
MSIITNFRDLGGIQTINGQHLLPRRLLRSAELSQLAAEEARQLLQDYRLNKVVDFRSEEEVLQRPDLHIDGICYVHIDLQPEVRHMAHASISTLSRLESISQTHDYMLALYQQLAVSPTSQAGYQQFFLELLNNPAHESVLFHCAAGKDRTGIATMLILEALEVARPRIYQDYLQTNRLRQAENTRLLAQAAAAGADQAQQAAFAIALQVDSRYLDRFYRTVEEHYGSMDDYLQSAIGLDTHSKRQLRQQYLQ